MTYRDKWLEFEGKNKINLYVMWCKLYRIALEEPTEDAITKVIEQRNKMNSQFKGVISIVDEESYLRSKHIILLWVSYLNWMNK